MLLAVKQPKAFGLNESPSEKEGKITALVICLIVLYSLNESPSEKEGKKMLTLQNVRSP